jgi:hypothetical protein
VMLGDQPVRLSCGSSERIVSAADFWRAFWNGHHGSVGQNERWQQ